MYICIFFHSISSPPSFPIISDASTGKQRILYAFYFPFIPQNPSFHFFPYIPPYVPSFVFALQLATCLIHVNPPSTPVSPGCFRKQELLNHSDSLKKWRVGFNGGWGIYVKTIEMFASVAAAVPWVDGSDQYNSVGGGGGELVCCHHIKTSPVSRPAIRKA
jgi:hypothetical protein